MLILVLAAEPVDAELLRRAIGEEIDGAEVLVIAPAVNESALAFWVSDSDEAIADAQERLDVTLASLREAGITARGATGESEPLVALQDALATYAADRIVVVVRESDATRYREDDVIGEAQRRFGVPVVGVDAPAS
ncbi:MAG: hypothetical protein H0U79_06820 [Solirubrobacterales bacterium]|nr:hypothetical protein [Solirubrobacterales bacterium]